MIDDDDTDFILCILPPSSLIKTRENAIVDGLDYQIPVYLANKKSASYRSFLAAVYEISLPRHIKWNPHPSCTPLSLLIIDYCWIFNEWSDLYNILQARWYW